MQATGNELKCIASVWAYINLDASSLCQNALQIYNKREIVNNKIIGHLILMSTLLPSRNHTTPKILDETHKTRKINLIRLTVSLTQFRWRKICGPHRFSFTHARAAVFINNSLSLSLCCECVCVFVCGGAARSYLYHLGKKTWQQCHYRLPLPTCLHFLLSSLLSGHPDTAHPHAFGLTHAHLFLNKNQFPRYISVLLLLVVTHARTHNANSVIAQQTLS